jgi:DHA2 family multidrug resistance protein
MARGADAATASRQAYAAVFGTVQRQAAMLAFNETFHVLALLFLAAMLLLLFMKKPAHYGGGAPAH